MTILAKVRRSLRSTPRLERDEAAVELALTYARHLDVLFVRLVEAEHDDDDMSHSRCVREIDTLGRRLETVLDRLGMSPASRPSVRDGGGEVGGDPRAAALDAARAEHAGADSPRVDYAAAVDPAVTAADAGD